MRSASTRSSVLAILIAFGLGAYANGAPQAAPSPSASPVAPVRPPRLEYAIDLAQPDPKTPVIVPTGQTLDVTLSNAAPFGAYRYSIEQVDPNRPPHARPARPLAVYPRANFALPSFCPTIAAAWDGFLDVGAEESVSAAVTTLSDAARGTKCEGSVSGLERLTHRMLNEPQQVGMGTRIRVTIERLAGDGTTVSRRWVASFAPGRVSVGLYPTEQAALAAGIVRDLVELAAFANVAPAPAADAVRVSLVGEGTDPLRIEITGPGAPLTRDVALDPHVFAPALYVELARALIGAKPVRPVADAPAHPSVLEAIADLRAASLLKEARRVSARLTTAPRDARAHEEAAVLWGAFALRESGGAYSDCRTSLARATAHLAFAQALRAARPPAREAAWANVLIATLAGRSLEAVASIDALGATTDAERAWAVALRVRNDGDWRKVTRPAERTLVEQLEFVRAKARAIDDLVAITALDGVALPPIPDWARILMTDGATVETANRFGPSAIALELADLALAHGLTREAGTDVARAAELLRRTDMPIVGKDAAGGRAVAVLGPGAWSAAAARNIAEQAEARNDELDHLFRLPEAGEAFRAGTTPLLRALPLFPIVESSWATKPSPSQEFCSAMNAVVKESPLALPATLWVKRVENRCGQTAGFPPSRAFFDPPVARGTSLDARARMTGSLGLVMTAADLKGYRALAPQDSDLVFAALAREYRAVEIPSDVLAKEYGPFAEYQVRAARKALLSLEKNPPAYRRMAEKMCALAADHCGTLGRLLITAGDEDAAAVAYQRLIENGVDRVGASNAAPWLVDYYEEREQSDRALAIAQLAEETGSGSGYQTMGRLLESRGSLAEAEKRYIALRDRYKLENPLRDFHMRAAQRPGGERWAAEAEAARAKVFPNGLERMPKGDTAAPTKGAVLTEPSAGLLQAGIRPGDTVVAIDGYRVTDPHQYGAVKALAITPKMVLTIWHEGKYVEVEERRGRNNYFR
jgi:hypothetical protein